MIRMNNVIKCYSAGAVQFGCVNEDKKNKTINNKQSNVLQ